MGAAATTACRQDRNKIDNVPDHNALYHTLTVPQIIMQQHNSLYITNQHSRTIYRLLKECII